MLAACSGSGPAASSTQSGSGAPATGGSGSVSAAMQLVGELRNAGLPVTATVERGPGDDADGEFEGLISKVDFRDSRLLSANRSIDEDADGGSLEVYQDERAAI